MQTGLLMVTTGRRQMRCKRQCLSYPIHFRAPTASQPPILPIATLSLAAPHHIGARIRTDGYQQGRELQQTRPVSWSWRRAEKDGGPSAAAERGELQQTDGFFCRCLFSIRRETQGRPLSPSSSPVSLTEQRRGRYFVHYLPWGFLSS